ncbi:MAG: exopolysaccharide biosynthesis protein [Candidatus Accumulibacter sp.]|nr:exopolysaccharide biosynthesis protein [Accumulibacter sp.]
MRPADRDPSSPGTPQAGHLPLSDILRLLADDASRERIFIRDLVDTLGDRALAALMFIFALPNVFPTPPGTSAVLGAPLVFLTAQLALGRKLWLPDFVRNRSLSFHDFQILVRRIAPWLARAESLLRPRASCLADPPMEYVIGLICFILSVILALPIPLGNIVPALAICLMALGILEDDGWWIVAGFLAAVIAVAIVSGVFFAMFETTLFLKQWLF